MSICLSALLVQQRLFKRRHVTGLAFFVGGITPLAPEEEGEKKRRLGVGQDTQEEM